MAIKKNAKPKSKIDYNDPLAIWNEMAGLDQKDYGYYDRLNSEQQKKFSPYLLLRWGACVEGSTDISGYYAVAFNEYSNENFWTISKHKKLAWLTLCSAVPGIGKQKHYWLGAPKKGSGNALKNTLLELLPNTKEKDIDLILSVNSNEEIVLWLRQQGLEESQIKKLTA